MPTPLEQFAEAIDLALAQLDESEYWLEQMKNEPEAVAARQAVPDARRALEVVRDEGLRNTGRKKAA